MAAKDEFIKRLSPDFEWQHIGAGTLLLTAYQGQALPCPTRLELDEKLFERYVAQIARTSENGDRNGALGLIYIHLEETIAASVPDFGVLSVGIERGKLGRPRWFATRIQADQLGDVPHTVWTGEPPQSQGVGRGDQDKITDRM